MCYNILYTLYTVHTEYYTVCCIHRCIYCIIVPCITSCNVNVLCSIVVFVLSGRLLSDFLFVHLFLLLMLLFWKGLPAAEINQT